MAAVQGTETLMAKHRTESLVRRRSLRGGTARTSWEVPDKGWSEGAVSWGRIQ